LELGIVVPVFSILEWKLRISLHSIYTTNISIGIFSILSSSFTISQSNLLILLHLSIWFHAFILCESIPCTSLAPCLFASSSPFGLFSADGILPISLHLFSSWASIPNFIWIFPPSNRSYMNKCYWCHPKCRKSAPFQWGCYCGIGTFFASNASDGI
jgi:hypothetical protein